MSHECVICLEPLDNVIDFCNCKGTHRYHRACIDRLLSDYQVTQCSICHAIFKVDTSYTFYREKLFYNWFCCFIFIGFFTPMRTFVDLLYPAGLSLGCCALSFLMKPSDYFVGHPRVKTYHRELVA